MYAYFSLLEYVGVGVSKIYTLESINAEVWHSFMAARELCTFVRKKEKKWCSHKNWWNINVSILM